MQNISAQTLCAPFIKAHVSLLRYSVLVQERYSIAARVSVGSIEQSGFTSLAMRLALVVRGEERERLHQLVALGDGNVAVVQPLGRPAIHVKPPVALEDGLVEQCRLWAQEALHDEPIISESTHMEHLPMALKAR